ncbi:HutD family protein [Kribbella sandramycini]
MLRAAEHRPVPWKNGLGVTYEVAHGSGEPPGDRGAADRFDWRLSFAEIERPGAFSVFPGIDRILTVAAGDELRLMLPRARVLRPFEPFAFAGEAEVTAEVAAPVVAFNVMTRRGVVTAAVECRRVTGEESVQGDFLAVLDGAFTVGSELLGVRDVVAGPPASVTGAGVVAVVALSPNLSAPASGGSGAPHR